ncbi:MAG: hypothetical protein IT379_11815 [Deltaproteobacteria bacterium]|nr:hypothetical protein [Deltaproteobacteria bacterium]
MTEGFDCAHEVPDGIFRPATRLGTAWPGRQILAELIRDGGTRLDGHALYNDGFELVGRFIAIIGAGDEAVLAALADTLKEAFGYMWGFKILVGTALVLGWPGDVRTSELLRECRVTPREGSKFTLEWEPGCVEQ